MLNKLVFKFIFVIGLLYISSCSKGDLLQQLNNNLTYNKDKLNPLSDYQHLLTTTEDWLYLYFNKQNLQLNFSLKNTHFNFKLLAAIYLGSQYDNFNITPNFVIENNTLYIINSNNYLLIVNLNTYKIINKIKLSFLKDSSPVGLAYHNDYLYITTNKGTVSAFYKNGEESWSVNLLYPIQSAPIVDNNRLFVVANNSVFALNTISGESLWEYKDIENGITISRAIIPTIYENFLAVGLSNGTILFLRKENGQKVWHYTIHKGRSLISNTIIAPPIIVNNGTNILFSSFNNKTYLVDPLKNYEVWQNPTIGYINLPVIINNHLFTLDTSTTLNNIDLKDGSSYWSLNLANINKKLNFMNWFGPIWVNNNLLIYNNRGEIYILSPHNGCIVATYKLNLKWNDKLTPNMVIVNQKIIVLGMKYIYIIE